jgi:NFACT protein RNA binding domain/NFACT N-terminal and middle domains
MQSRDSNPPAPPPRPQPDDAKLTLAQRARLLSQVAALTGATLQKLWLGSPGLLTLQLRVPGKTVLVVLDARAAMAALVAERPQAAGAAPKSQAALRASLAGASLAGARLTREEGAPPGSRQTPSLRLLFQTPQGRRALSTEPRTGAIALLAVAPDEAVSSGDRILWMSASKGDLRPGGLWPTMRVDSAAGASPAGGAAEDELAARVLEGGQAASAEAQARELVKLLRARAQKLARTLQAVEADGARAAKAGEERARAQLLLPEQSRIPRGALEARVPDWSRIDPEGRPAQVVVALDPALSAAQNAARWMKRAQRYLAALPRIEARRAEVAAQLAETRALLAAAEAAPDANALRELSLRAARAGAGAKALRAGAGAGQGASPRGGRGERGPARKPSARVPYRTFQTEGGARILVGRSARDNDALTFGAARGNDLWLHARGVQGSHVVVPDPGEAPDERTLLEAAVLAAHFSSARGEDQVEVAWTRKKHVRKQKGAPPGAVTYAQERGFRVRMTPTLVAAILSREEK